MSHIRQQIREQFASDLTGLTTTGANVFQSRVYPLEIADLPGLAIYTISETSDINEMGPTGNRTVKRNLALMVEGIAQANSNLDDTIDTICKEVETALANSSVLDTLCEDWFLSSTDINLAGDASKPTGKVSLEYTVTYYNIENDPETPK